MIPTATPPIVNPKWIREQEEVYRKAKESR